MLTVEQVQALMAKLEAPRVERKQSLSDAERVRQAICAFANDLGNSRQLGHILLGVDDKTGLSTGLEVDDKLLQNLGNMRLNGNIQPMPSMTVEPVDLPNGHRVVVVEVHPSDAPPVRLNGVTWVRPSNQRGVATPEEEKRLAERRVAGTRPFDLRACPGSSLTDLNVAAFKDNYLRWAIAPEIIAENQRTTEDQLASLRFLDAATRVPTYAGILVFGKDPQSFVPGAYVQFVRFAGLTLSDPVKDSQRFDGPLLELLKGVEQVLGVNVSTARITGEGLRMQDAPDYPNTALRELVFNAIAHRNYDSGNAPVRINWFDDRVELQSPGGLYGQVTPENFGRVSDYRNPTIGEAMKVLGFVEKFGSGIAKTQRALANNGNPPALFEFWPTHFLATVRNRQ
jgi:ATP-dependent DNA helicase RecG